MSRAVGVGLVAVGVAMIGAFAAAKSGHLAGVALDWPAALFGGVVAVVGLVVALPSRTGGDGPRLWRPPARGPLPESGLDEALAAEAASNEGLDAQLRAEALRRRDPRAEHGGQ